MNKESLYGDSFILYTNSGEFRRMKKNKNQFTFLAVEVLNHLGITKPKSRQIQFINAILGNVTVKYPINFNKKLSKREISCLYWAAMGKTSEETAEILQISPTTVDSHRKQIKQKLNCYNLTQAVFEGMRWGCINIFHDSIVT